MHGKPIGEFAENITYGTGTGIEAVLQMLVDDGNPERMQRDVMMSNAYRKIGVMHHEHKTFGNIVVIVFAADMLESHKQDPI